MSRAFQKIAYAGLGDEENLAAVEQREKAHRQSTIDGMNEMDDIEPVLWRMTAASPALFSAYLARVRADGEMLAHRQLKREIRQLLAAQPELACNPAPARNSS